MNRTGQGWVEGLTRQPSPPPPTPCQTLGARVGPNPKGLHPWTPACPRQGGRKCGFALTGDSAFDRTLRFAYFCLSLQTQGHTRDRCGVLAGCPPVSGASRRLSVGFHRTQSGPNEGCQRPTTAALMGHPKGSLGCLRHVAGSPRWGMGAAAGIVSAES